MDPDRNALEAAVQQLARRQLGPDHVPAVLDVDPANHAYAMEAAPPDARPWKQLLLAGHVEPSLGRHCRQLLEAFHRLRADQLPALVADARFFYQQRIEPYFEFTARRHPMVAGLIPWLRQPRGVTHGDFTPKNMLVAGSRIILLDYEVTHLGQPEFDYASLVNHLTLKWIHLPAQRPALAGTIRAFLDERPLNTRLVGALLLARVDGKSPVEYLTGDEPAIVRRLGRHLAATGPPMSADEFLRIVAEMAAAH